MEGSSAGEEDCGGAVGGDDACSSSAGLAAPPSAAEPLPEPNSDGGTGGAPSFCSPLAVISMAAAGAEADDGSSGRYVFWRLLRRRPCEELEWAKSQGGSVSV